MENMKRVLSAILAFVLVLGMIPSVPMFASAEEVESQPETVAAETTEAATEETKTPETSEPEESVPETTAAKETEAEESVPETTEETEPEESIPEETVPEETVELQEEVEATEEAMDAVVEEEFVTGITVTVKDNKKVTYVGDVIELTAVVTPESAVNKDVEYFVLEEIEGMDSYAPPEVDQEMLETEGRIFAYEAGRLAIGWRSADGNYHPFEKDEEDTSEEPEAEPIWVEFVEYRMEINKTAIPEDNRIEGGGYKMMAGENLEISVQYIQSNAIDGTHVGLPLHTPDVKWELVGENDELYASLQASGRDVIIVPKVISEKHVITLKATDQALIMDLEEEAYTDYLQVLINPYPTRISLKVDGDTVTEEERLVNIAPYHYEKKDIEFALSAEILPLAEGESQELVWTKSIEGGYMIFDKLEEDPEKDDTSHARVILPTETGKVTITVSSKENPSLSASVTFDKRLLVPGLAFTEKTEQLQNLTSGSSFQLQAVTKWPDGKKDNEILESKEIQWSLSEADQEYATISKTGKLTAVKNLVRGKTIQVICSVIDNEEEATIYKSVNIRPKATEVEIFYYGQDEQGARLVDESKVNGKTLTFNALEKNELQLYALVSPFEGEDAEDLGALQDVTWKTSSKAIAEVNEKTGLVRGTGKAGPVTITATAADGSGKKATVKLVFGVKIQSITIEDPSREEPDMGFTLRSGKSWTFDVTIEPEKPSNSKLTWTLHSEDGEDPYQFASISASGRLTAKTVYEEHDILVRAESQENPDVYDEILVTIAPKSNDQLSIQTTDGLLLTKTTQYLDANDPSDSLELVACAGGEQEEVTWGPVKNSVVDVIQNEDGSATVTAKKTGTATITAKTSDGRKATFVVRAVQLAEDIKWTHTHEQHNLASGKSLTLKAKAFYIDDKDKERTPTISKLAWSFQEEDAGDYATISSSGKVTARAGYKGEPVTLTVLVRTTDGSDIEYDWQITIAPAPEGVRIYDAAGEFAEAGSFVTSGTYAMMTPGEDQIELEARTVPGNDDVSFTWKTSNKKIATVEEGTVTCLKSGSVTITATANDGSGKKATFKLKIIGIAEFVSIDAYSDGEGIAIAGGKRLSLKGVAFDGNLEIIKGKKFEYEIRDYPGDTENGLDYVTLSGSTLKTKAVTGPKKILLTVKTKEDKEEWVREEDFLVVIRPATTDVEIIDRTGTEIKTTVLGYVGRSLQLYAKALPYEYSYGSNQGACQAFVWKSSNPKVADFEWDEDGSNMRLVCYKKGKVTITATAIDGSKKNDKITVEVWEP